MNPPTIPTTRSSKGRLTRNIIERAVVVIVLTASLSAIWWSVTRLIALQKRSSELSRQVEKLTSEIDIMRLEWSPTQTQDLARRFGDLHENLFETPSSVMEWTDLAVRDAIPLALDMKVSLGPTQISTNDAGIITRFPATFEIRPNPIALPTRSLYHRFLEWTRGIATEARRVDFVELTMTGISAGGGTMSATVELWGLDKSSNASPPVITSPSPTNAPVPSPANPASQAPGAAPKPPSTPTPAEPQPEPQATP